MDKPITSIIGVIRERLESLLCLLAQPQFSIYNFQFTNKFQISNFKFQICRGFTLIEMMVVLGTIGIVSTIAFWGLNSYKNVQPVENAQRELLTHLRALQNQAINGADRQNFKTLLVTNGASSYGYTSPSASDPNTSLLSASLPSGVAISQNNSAVSAQICFANPNKSTYGAASPADRCGLCANGGAGYQAFACGYNGTAYSIVSSGAITLTLSKGNVSRSVVVEGSGMRVTRMYAQ